MPWLLAAAKPSYPHPPTSLPEEVFVWAFAGLCALVIHGLARSETWRRFFLGLCDPRVYAVLRIGFGLMTIQCFVNLYPYWNLLWSDEGIFDAAYARDRLGRGALAGYVPGEGFLDAWAVVHFLLNKPSLFYLYGSPAFVAGYMGVFFALLALYTVGAGTRVVGPLAWLMMHGIYNRNALYWEGTDLVYRAMWFILLFARTDAAWSVDNWVRCRWLSRRGRLAPPGAPPEPGKEPVHRRVPAWPRYLVMWQLALIYFSTGMVKTGSIWRKGDALYYALNMDHFYRFEWYTQLVSYYLGTTLYRWMTWTVLLWERAFPLVLVGVVLRFAENTRDRPWARWERSRRLRRLAGYLALVAAWAAFARALHLAAPYLSKTPGGDPAEAAVAARLVSVLVWGVVPAVAVSYVVLGRVHFVLGRRPLRIGRLAIPPVRIDRAFVRRWIFGRRVYLGLGAAFHGFLILFMNIGMFPFIMLMSYAAFVDGETWVRAVARVRRCVLGRRAGAQLPGYLAPAQPHGTVRPRGGRAPEGMLLLAAAAGLAYLWRHGVGPGGRAVSGLGWGTVAVVTAAAWVGRLRRPDPRDLPPMVGPGPALVPSALRRAAAFSFLLFHGSALAAHLFPAAPVLGTVRRAISFHGGWLRATGTTQSWDMFAPNPPTANTFMITVVVEEDGDRWDLRNDAYRTRPNPFWINDRMRKMQRRMVGKGKWYLSHWGAYWCRAWYLRTGQWPAKVVVDKVVTRIPGPDLVRKKGPYHPRKLRARRSHVKTIDCRTKRSLPPEVARRHGLPAAASSASSPSPTTAKARREAWARRPKWLRAIFPSLFRLWEAR